MRGDQILNSASWDTGEPTTASFRPQSNGLPTCGAHGGPSRTFVERTTLSENFTISLPFLYRFRFFSWSNSRGEKLHHFGAVFVQLVERQQPASAIRGFWCKNGAETVQFYGVCGELWLFFTTFQFSPGKPPCGDDQR